MTQQSRVERAGAALTSVLVILVCAVGCARGQPPHASTEFAYLVPTGPSDYAVPMPSLAQVPEVETPEELQRNAELAAAMVPPVGTPAAAPHPIQSKRPFTPEWTCDASPLAGKLVVAASVPGDGFDADLVVLNADRSGIRRLTSGPAYDYDPQWSPQGDRVLYVSTQKDDRIPCRIRVVDERGGNPVTIRDQGDDQTGAAWSPDGRSIAYTQWERAGDDRAASVWVVALDTGEATKLAELGAAPAWSPDGERLAWVKPTEGRHGLEGELWVGGAGGGGRRIVERVSAYERPAWSPDGTRIAFVSWGDAGGSICTVSPDGTGVRTYTEPQTGCCAGPGKPAWSPDGWRIAYSRPSDGCGHSLAIISTRDSRVTVARSASALGSALVAWSPDGRWLLIPNRSRGLGALAADGRSCRFWTDWPAAPTGGSLVIGGSWASGRLAEAGEG